MYDEEKPKKGSVTEKSVEEGVYRADDKYQFGAHDLDQVQRRLKQRHVQMIAIAGTIGTGLFLGSGGALAKAGPLGALIAYALVGTVAYSTVCSVGEMTTWAPVSGTFPHFAARWVDPAFGFAVGWNYFYTNVISTPVEITAASILLTFWDSNTKHQGIYIAVVCIAICSINIFGVKYFGEAEFIFSIIKITLIIGLIIAGLIIDLGGGPNHDRIGFRYWKNPGAIARANLVSNIDTDRFLAILSVIVQASFSFQGMELVAIAASETESPRRNIAKAVRRVFYRITIFYVLGILIIGMLVAYNDSFLLQKSGTASESPFVIAFNRAGVKVLPHIINAAVFTSAFSAGNSFLFCSSRILYGLALRGQAPKVFAICTKNGLPIVAVMTASSFSLLAFMSVSNGANAVFNWFVNLSTTGGFFGWFSINLTYIFYRRGMNAQGFDVKKNIYNNPFQPYIAYWGCFWTFIFILINGFEVFFKFNIADFFTGYINIVIFFSLFFFWKIYKRTSMWKPEEMDLVTGIPSIEETELPEIPPRNIWEKIAEILF
ncbi:general APC amino acid permease [Amanita muscaria]